MAECCENMIFYASKKNMLLDYDHSDRSYGFHIYDSNYGTMQTLWYCPWCGKKLPEDLGEEWDEILEKEHGITDPFFEDKDKVPAEFWTDEWWKKRGL